MERSLPVSSSLEALAGTGREFGFLQRSACKLRSPDFIPTIIAGCSRSEFRFERQAGHLRYTPVANMPLRRKTFRLKLPSRTLVLGERTLVMGVLNVTPDSFSDGGKFPDPQSPIEHALEMEQAGADMLDIGGGATPRGSPGTPPGAEQRPRVP